MITKRNCSHCKVSIDTQRVYWRPVNGIEFPFCSVLHWFEYRKGKEVNDEKAMAQTSGSEKAQSKLRL